MKEKKNKIALGMDEKIFDFVNYTLLTVLGIIFIYPVLFVFSASVSNPYLLQIGDIFMFPKGFNIEAFKSAAKMEGIWLAYGNTIFITVAGTLTSMLFTVTGAYVLSKPYLKYRKFFLMAIVVTMWFDPGMIPRYLNFRSLGMVNSYSSIILGFALNTFNVIILKSFFESVPVSLEESAKIDGASQWQIMRKIYLPLSKAALTTVALFYAITKWNGYFWTMVLLVDDKKAPLQVFLKKMIVDKNMAGESAQMITRESLTSPETIIYAVIVISIVPILVMYPFIQKFFKKGVTLGAVKE